MDRSQQGGAGPAPSLEAAAGPAGRTPRREGRPSCADCLARRVCFVMAAQGETVLPQAALVVRRRVAAGADVLAASGPHRPVHILRSGSAKSTLTTASGREHVTAFHLPGDLLGLGSGADPQHGSVTIALEDSEVCAVPLAVLGDTLAGAQPMRQRLWTAIAAEIARAQALAAALASQRAEARVAGFLLDLSRRLQARGYAAGEFHMRMSRAEVGSYLGVTLETVSRTLSAFALQGLLAVRRRHIRLLDPEGLAREARS